MRLCYLADAKSPHTQKWVNHFAGLGHEIHVVSFRHHEIPDANVHCIPPPFINHNNDQLHAGRNSLQKAAYLLCIRSTRRLMRQIKPDILHAFLATSYGLAGTLSGFHPLIISSLGSEVVVLPNHSAFYRRLVKFNLKRADVITATSTFLAQTTKKFCPADKRVEAVPFGVDTKLFSNNTRKYSRDQSIVIGTVKILEQNYGIDRLIQVFSRVVQHNPNRDLSLLIVGGGSMEGSLSKLARWLGVANRVTFVGYLPHAKVVAYLDQIDIFVSLPESESFGVSVVEASSCGIPVVVSKVDGVPEVVRDGKTGFLVSPVDINGAARKITTLINDVELRSRMGQAGRQFVLDHYDWKQTAEHMSELYNDMYRLRKAQTNESGTRRSRIRTRKL